MTENSLTINNAVTVIENAVVADVLILSDSINSHHPVWGELINNGYSPVEASIDNPPCRSKGNCIILIDSTDTMPSEQWLEYLIKYQGDIAESRRILIHHEEDRLSCLKMRIFGSDTSLEISQNDYSPLINALKNIGSNPQTSCPNCSHDWKNISRSLFGAINQNLNQCAMFKELISLAPSIKEYEYTIKSVLKMIIKAFNVPMASICISDDEYIYTLIEKPVPKNLFDIQIEKLKKDIEPKFSTSNVSEVIWGRSFLQNDTVEANLSPVFMTHQLQSKGITIGYWVAQNAYKEDEIDDCFVSMISQQISLLVHYAWLYKRQNETVSNNLRRLSAINETCKLMSDLDSRDFGLQFLLIMLEHLPAEKGFLLLCDNEGGVTSSHSVGFSNEVLDTIIANGASINIKNTYLGQEPTYGNLLHDWAEQFPDEFGMAYTGFPLAGVQGRLGVIYVFFRTAPSDLSEYLPFLNTMAILAGSHFETLDLYVQSIEKRVIEEQLNIAREIQRQLLPKEKLEMQTLDIEAKSIPATKVGGDLYDYVNLYGGKTGIVIGDVSGKGVAASILMSMTKSLLKFHLQRHNDISAVFDDVNNYLVRESPQEKFVTAQVIAIDELNKKIDIVNAGHEFLLAYRAATDSFEHIKAEGLPLGILQNASYEKVETSYQTGDILLMFTDGLTESMNPDRKLFGMERIYELVRRSSHLNSKEILEVIYEAIWAHTANGLLHDDTTIIALKAK